jgi:hypothetical protein
LGRAGEGRRKRSELRLFRQKFSYGSFGKLRTGSARRYNREGSSISPAPRIVAYALK